jgi:gliding motility-associated lipoprotein GldH
MKTQTQILSFIIFLTAFSFISCNNGPVFEKYLKMKDSVWDRFSMKIFEIPIEDVGKNYDISLIVRNTDKFEYDKLPVYVILTTPSGEERMREINIPIRENGKMLGEPKEKSFEVKTILWKEILFSDKGNCKISIENIIPKIQTEGIDEIGIVVTKSK